MRYALYQFIAVALIFVLGCGGGRSTTTPKKAQPEPAASAPEPAPAPEVAPAVTQRPAPAPVPAASTSTPSPAPDATPKLTTGLDQVFSGFSLGTLRSMLASSDKAKIEEAIAVLELSGSRAKDAAPFLQPLTTHADAEIATAAQRALTAIGK